MSDLARAARTDRRTALEAMRDKLAGDLEDATPRESAALSRELRAVLTELDALATGREASAVDELAKRRAVRLTEAAG